MLICEKNWFVVEIPKAGSSTMQVILDKKFNGTSLNGHHTVSEAIARNDGKEFDLVMAIIRHPEDRLVSAVNHLLSNLNLHPDDRPAILKAAGDILQGAVKGYERKTHLVHYFVFKPQYLFLDTHHPVKLFTFPKLQEAADFLGYTDPIPHANKSNKWVSKSDVEVLPAYRDVMALYEKDLELYESYSIMEM
jgi:hypothetical protein